MFAPAQILTSFKRMCGRYRRTTSEEELARLFHISIPKQTDLPIYEWRKTIKPKLPFAVAMKDGRPITFAGLWENWKDPQTDDWMRTCTIITGEPNELVAQIHPRMPVILPEKHHASWLGETGERELKRVTGPLSCCADANVGNFSADKQPEE